jgi:hypothetical protein
MESTRLLYDQYRFEKAAVEEETRFDMIKRIEDYRNNVNLYNSLRTIPSDKSIASQKEISIKRT